MNRCSSVFILFFFIFNQYTSTVNFNDIETATMPQEKVEKSWRKLVAIDSYFMHGSDFIFYFVFYRI